jgi:hypothetical protein
MKLKPDLYYSYTFAGLLMWGVLSERGQVFRLSESVSNSLFSVGIIYILHVIKYGRSPVQVPEKVDCFNPSNRTMALGSTQPLTEMSTRNLPGG